MTEKPSGKSMLTATVGGAALGLIAVVGMFEGKPGLEPHWDRIGKVWDVCYGDTIAEKRSYTEEECRDLLAHRLAEFAEPVLKRNPEIKGHDPQVLAAVSLAYNIGVGAYQRSTVAKRFSEGKWASACNAFLSWSYSRGKFVQGLANRRNAERKICLRDIPERYRR